MRGGERKREEDMGGGQDRGSKRRPKTASFHPTALHVCARVHANRSAQLLAKEKNIIKSVQEMSADC